MDDGWLFNPCCLAVPLRLPKPLGTRQLLIDFEGGRPIPRLREPRDLFTIPSLSSPFQGVRWPAECDVTGGLVQHIGMTDNTLADS